MLSRPLGRPRGVRDPARSIVEVVDAADQTLFFSGSTPVGAGQQYEYDAIYRITSAAGREDPGQAQPVGDDSPLASHPHPNDSQADAGVHRDV